jgi:hypothetical protein
MIEIIHRERAWLLTDMNLHLILKCSVAITQ